MESPQDSANVLKKNNTPAPSNTRTENTPKENVPVVANGPVVANVPVINGPANKNSANHVVANNTPVNNTSANKVNNTPVNNAPANNTPANNTSVNNTSVNNTSVNNTSVNNTPANHIPANHEPAESNTPPTKEVPEKDGQGKSPEGEEPPQYAYTGGGYWGGSWLPYWILVTVSVLGGFVGLDHLLLRSPQTAILKFLTNIFLVGTWYFYDLFQLFGDKATVVKYGLSVPFGEPKGIGAGAISEKLSGGDGKKPYWWLIYLFSVFTPLGIDHWIAGDTMGGLAKFLSLVIPILWPFAILWYFVDIWRAWIKPNAIWENGIYRVFPWSFLFESYLPTKLAPKDPPPGDGTYRFLGPLGPILGLVLDPVIENAISPATNAVKAVAGTVEATADVATTSIQGVSTMIDAAVGTAAPVIRSARAVASAVPGALNTATRIVENTTNQLQQFNDPRLIQELARKQLGQQGGGASASSVEMGATGGVLATLVGGGLIMGALRLRDAYKKSSYAVPSWDDSPYGS